MERLHPELAPRGHLQVVGSRGHRKWRAFWWDADGKHSRVLGPAWVQSSGKRSARGAVIWHSADGRKPDSSYLTPKEAELALRHLLEHEAAKRPTPRSVHGAALTFADAAEEWLSHGERKRNLKRSTLRDYRQVLDSYLLAPANDAELNKTPYGRAPFATTSLRELHAEQVKGWYDRLPYGRTTEKLLMVTRAIFSYARSRGWIEQDPTATVERQALRYSGDYDFYSREEVAALVRAAREGRHRKPPKHPIDAERQTRLREQDHQDAALYLTAAMTGLRRGELVALRWRDVDFPGQAIRVRANYSEGQLVTPKSGKVRSVPMVPDVARELAQLGQREHFTTDTDPVFVGQVGQHIDASALRRRYAATVEATGLRHLPLHSLRHHFGSIAVNRASLVQVQSWMGHAHIQTTARYLHAKSQADDAALLASAFTPAGEEFVAAEDR